MNINIIVDNTFDVSRVVHVVSLEAGFYSWRTKERHRRGINPDGTRSLCPSTIHTVLWDDKVLGVIEQKQSLKHQILELSTGEKMIYKPSLGDPTREEYKAHIEFCLAA